MHPNLHTTKCGGLPEGRSPHRRERGSAMVTALALVVLMTVIVMALFMQVRTNQMVTDSNNERAVTDAVVLGAADYAENQLLTAVQNANSSANGTASGTFGTTNYSFYLTNTNGVMISRNFTTNSAGYDNLLLQSVNNSGANVDSNASTVSTSATNGRYIAPSRWYLPQLTTSTANFANAGAPIPNWVYLASTGATNVSGNTGNIARFAYNIYNTSSLLNMNAAGSSTTASQATLATSSFVSLLGSLAGADLTAIANNLSGANLVTMRTTGPAAWMNTYTNFVISSTANGYTNAYLTNAGTGGGNGWWNPFTSRQDLLRYLNNQGVTGVANMVTHFGRFVNGPSGGPLINAPNNNYLNNASSAAAINRFLPSVVVSSAFPRMTGEQAVVGEPLMKYKFPLSRLAWVAGNSTAGEDLTALNVIRAQNNASAYSGSAITAAFGLTSAGGGWTYNHGSTTSILTLDQVQQAGREPDFFELLKAGILSGSLGQTISITYPSGAYATPATMTSDLQILQIGANAIDQADSDSVPTKITFNGQTVYGIENTPRIYGLAIVTNRPQQPVGTAGPEIDCYIQPILWNPNYPSGVAPAGNWQFKFPSGSITMQYIDGSTGTPTSIPVQPLVTTTFTPSASSSPTFPIAAPGLLCGKLNPGTPPPSANTKVTYQFTNFQIDMYDNAGNLIDSFLLNTGAAVDQPDNSTPSGTTPGTYFPANYGVYFLRVDPRTSRFGWQLYTNTYTAATLPSSFDTPRPQNASPVPRALIYTVPTAITFNNVAPGNPTASIGTIADNISTGTGMNYKDPDGVLRSAEGANSTFYTDNANALPVILNQQLYSVGCLGYVFRDVPWKNLDMFTANSGDAGLLDLFSVYEEPAISAAKMNPNTPYSNDLAALMNNNSHLQDANVSIGNTGANQYAANFAGTNAAAPRLRAPSEIVTAWAAANPLALTAGTTSPENLKIRSELITRSVASEANMRTWNFMIDVIAQTGKVSQATGAFNVTGERRVWVHVAIDRVSGKVIAKEVEPVVE